jgi:hypothetical protein
MRKPGFHCVGGGEELDRIIVGVLPKIAFERINIRRTMNRQSALRVNDPFALFCEATGNQSQKHEHYDGECCLHSLIYFGSTLNEVVPVSRNY